MLCAYPFDLFPGINDEASFRKICDCHATVKPGTALQTVSNQATVNANGTFTYDPNGEFNSLTAGQTATDTFTYTVSDSVGETSLSSATVTITINGVASP